MNNFTQQLFGRVKKVAQVLRIRNEFFKVEIMETAADVLLDHWMFLGSEERQPLDELI